MRRVIILLMFVFSCLPADGANLVKNGNGTVTDCNTGLMWQQGEAGFMAWDSALSYCAGLSLGGHSDWRLPNIKELEALTDDSRYNPAADTVFFPDVHASYYWSSTSYADVPNVAWVVYFDYGNVYGYGKFNTGYVRCVHGGQPALLPMSWIAGKANYSRTLQGVHNDASHGDVIEADAGIFRENLTISRLLTLRGGFDGDYSGESLYTHIFGALTIQSGCLTVENLIIM
jgi:hypothetical protein